MRRATGLSLLLLLLVGCERDRDLTAHAVMNIPAGDASGSEWSGDYTLEVETIECSGKCGPFENGPFDVEFCVVGERNTDRAEVAQTDGVLESTMNTNLLREWQGGIDADGSFDLGSVDEEDGVEYVGRSRGSIEGEGEIVGMTELRATGRYNGQRVDCTATREFVGSRDGE